MNINELFTELEQLEPSEKLEWLVDFSEELPELSPEKKAAPFPESCRVSECQTTIHLWVTVNQGRIHLEADVPRQSPIVRGLVAMLICGLEGAEISDGINLPDDLVAHLGLSSVVGMTRQKGFRGVIARIKRGLRASEE